MDYKNDNRTPRDRITGEFLSELLLQENEMRTTRERSAPTVAAASTCPCRNSGRTSGGVSIVGDVSLAMAYIQMQEFGELYGESEGFCEGTIFKELRFPFYPTPGYRGGRS